MGYQSVFKRYEIKYLLTKNEKEQILKSMEPYMCLDQYGHTTIRNIYFDTDTFLLIRRSIEKPIFKEKLRIRSYKKVDSKDPVFVELKKKYKGVVYKRRLSLPESDAMAWIKSGRYPRKDEQISREIDYFLSFYDQLKPAVFLSYEREAFFDKAGSDFRVTFDENIISRREELSLCADVWGDKLLSDDFCLMEIKTGGGIPLWMTHTLTELKIFKTSFSKYGNVYRTTILKNPKGGFLYA